MLDGGKGDGPPPDWKPNTKMLYASASVNGWTHQGVKDLILFKFKRASTKDLTYFEYWKVMDWIGTVPPNSLPTERDKNTEDLFAS